jgi:hypothetical protein
MRPITSYRVPLTAPPDGGGAKLAVIDLTVQRTAVGNLVPEAEVPINRAGHMVVADGRVRDGRGCAARGDLIRTGHTTPLDPPVSQKH